MKQTRIKSNDVTLNVYHNNIDADESIVFVHGFPDNHSSWRYQIEYFKDKYNVAAFDLRGVGMSSEPDNRHGYNISSILPDYENVIKFISKGKPVHLVAHDWGAIIGWFFAFDPYYRRQIKSFTAISCPHIAILKEGIIQKMSSFDPSEWLNVLSQLTKSWYVYFFQLPWLPEYLIKNFPSFLWQQVMNQGELPLNDPMRRMSDEEIISSTINTVNLYREGLQNTILTPPDKTKLPINLLIPNHDLALDPATYDSISDYVINLSKTYFDANHWVHREKPELVNKNLESFFKKIKS